MDRILPPVPCASQPVRSETRPRMVKADLRKADGPDWRATLGAALERMRLLAGFASLKELAAAIGRDERQIARWIAGSERPQFDALFAVPALRQPLVVALAELALADGVDIVTQITVRRRA